MFGLLKLIRIKTLIYAVLTMYAMRNFVLRPALELNDLTLQMHEGEFFLLILAICFLISAAYVINDYFDMKSDRISGVRKILVGKTISRLSAIKLHTLLNIFAVGIAFLLGYRMDEWTIGFVFLLVSAFLWFYSCVYKKHFIVGNFFIGFLFALVPVCVGLFEISLLKDFRIMDNIGSCGSFFIIYYSIFGFGWFIFLNTVMREINKDMFSLEGDKANRIKTIPVIMGIKSARRIISLLDLLALLSLLFLERCVFWGEWYVFLYIILLVAVPYVLYLLVININMNRKLHLALINLIFLTSLSVSIFLPYIIQ